MCTKNDFHILVPDDFDPLTFDLEFAPLVTLVQRYVYDTIRYDTIEEFNMDSKAEYTA